MQVDDAVQREPVDQPRAPIASNVRLALVAAGLALVVVHVWIASRLPDKGPFVLGDEGGYLGNATYLVHRYGHPVDGYFGGYSLFLVPAALLRSAPHAYYETALYTNALLSFATATLAFLLARELFPRLRVSGAALVAAAVVLEPYVFVGTHLAMSENALVPASLLTAWLLARQLERPTIATGVLGGLAASFAFWISPRGTLLVVAFAIVHLLAWLRRQERFPLVAATGAATALSMGVGFVFNRALRGHSKVPGVDSATEIPSLTKASTWRDLIAGTGGRLDAFGFATAGLAVVGLVATVVWIRRVRAGANAKGPGAPTPAQLTVGLFASLAVLLTVLSTALTMSHTRLDGLYYARYAEGIGMPLVVVGSAWMLSWSAADRPRLAAARVALGAGAVMIGGALCVRLFPKPAPIYTEAAVNVLGVFAVRDVFGLDGYKQPLLVGAILATAALALAVVDARLALVAVLVLSVGAASTIHSDFLLPSSRLRRGNEKVARLVTRLGAVGIGAHCISYEGAAAGGWPLRNEVFLLPKWRFHEAKAPRYRRCGALDLTIGSKPRSAGDWRRVGDEGFFVPSTLWIDMASVPASTRDRVAALLPAG